MKLYIIRHGQTVNNQTKHFSGWSHTVLTEKGIKDAQQAGKILNGIVFDKIYTSDLPRTIQTCQNALPGCKSVPTELIREINVGSLTDRPFAQCVAEMTEEEVQLRLQRDYTPWGGENRKMLRERTRKFLNLLESDPCENVAAFSHEVFIKCLLEEVMGMELPYETFAVQNGAVCVFEYGNDRWKMIHWNLIET